MTDEKIIEALECCVRYENHMACRGCPFSESGVCEADGLALQKHSLDLIKRQQEEIERLKQTPKCVFSYDGETLEYCVEGPCPAEKTIETIRAEAVREFAERLKEKATSTFYEERKYVDTEDIDELVKEMTEKEGGNG